ncbi:hypothetical protein GIB67_034819 [Kingdonia uniflora]|uniref:Uncharacterized protein n=1 Tax=Kingdonia uniflora TaxID=39325 RepID=A0A7J7ME03_9MAGN|nr:hypothetical protein GIB67_034819 [Kingdonia uniflora]
MASHKRSMKSTKGKEKEKEKEKEKSTPISFIKIIQQSQLQDHKFNKEIPDLGIDLRFIRNT